MNFSITSFMIPLLGNRNLSRRCCHRLLPLHFLPSNKERHVLQRLPRPLPSESSLLGPLLGLHPRPRSRLAHRPRGDPDGGEEHLGPPLVQLPLAGVEDRGAGVGAGRAGVGGGGRSVGAAGAVGVGEGVALEAGDGVGGGGWGEEGRGVDEEAGGAEGLGVQTEDAGGAEAAEEAAVADVVEEEEAALLHAAVAAHGGGSSVHRRLVNETNIDSKP